MANNAREIEHQCSLPGTSNPRPQRHRLLGRLLLPRCDCPVPTIVQLRVAAQVV